MRCNLSIKTLKTILLTVFLVVLSRGFVLAENVGVGAFLGVDRISTVTVSPTEEEQGIFVDVTVRVLSLNGVPLPNHSGSIKLRC